MNCEGLLFSMAYQIKLFRPREIEIFNNVLRHNIFTEENKLTSIKIEYGQEGCSTHSLRPLDDVYDIHIKDNSELVARPIPFDVKVVTHG